MTLRRSLCAIFQPPFCKKYLLQLLVIPAPTTRIGPSANRIVIPHQTPNELDSLFMMQVCKPLLERFKTIEHFSVEQIIRVSSCAVKGTFCSALPTFFARFFSSAKSRSCSVWAIRNSRFSVCAHDPVRQNYFPAQNGKGSRRTSGKLHGRRDVVHSAIDTRVGIRFLLVLCGEGKALRARQLTMNFQGTFHEQRTKKNPCLAVARR